MCAKKRWIPILNALELLLQGHPDELLDIAVDGEPESARAAYTRAARNWAGREVLTPEERERIRAVWLAGEHRPSLNVNRARREELRALVLPRRASRERMDAEQLQAAMGGEG